MLRFLPRSLDTHHSLCRGLVRGAALAAMLTTGSLAQAGDSAADRVAAALGSGAFNDAAIAARDAETPEQRASLLAQVAAARTAGDAVVDRVAGMAPQQPELNGGTGADFDTLITLIQNQTAGPWEAVDGTGGTIDSFESGIRVDPTGLLEQPRKLDRSGKLAELRERVRTADLNDDMAAATPLRVLSLTQLEKSVAASLAAGEPIPESMRRLGGLTRIEYVFVDDATGELLIGGPAEGWSYDAAGRAIGIESGRPTLSLDDLVVTLRAFESADRFGCSIDPRPENIDALQSVVASSAGSRSPAGTRAFVRRLQDALGQQDVTVHGVPAGSRLARVMVEADYRMKLIGAGELEGGPAIPSYFELLAAHPEHIGGSVEAMRWWLTLNVEAIEQDEAGRSFQLTGTSVRCQSENQLLTADGHRVSTGQAEPMNQLFAKNFTEHYAELAAEQPVFADLQGLFDLSLVSALITRDGLDAAAGWDRGCFADGGAFRTAEHASPTAVESVVTHRVFPGGKVVIQAAGGVAGNAMAIVSDRDTREIAPRIASVRKEALEDATAAKGWWWNAQ